MIFICIRILFRLQSKPKDPVTPYKQSAIYLTNIIEHYIINIVKTLKINSYEYITKKYYKYVLFILVMHIIL